MLGKKGEIEQIHPILGIGREIVVSYMRESAVTNGHSPIKVGNRGRQKTTAKMAMLTVARSPLSRHGNVVESMASVGTALSLISGMEYATQYLAGKKQYAVNAQDQTSSARNGEFRKVAASPNERVASFIDHKLPSVMPNHLTCLGELLVVGSAAMTLCKPETKWAIPLAIGPYTLGGLIDGIDGNLARIKGQANLEGMLKDVHADKRQEIFTASVNSLLASRRGNRVAAAQYAVAAMTASLPALFRAAAESKGHIVSEDSSGSRVVRGIEGGVGLGLNTNSGISNVVSGLMSVGNVLTATQRADVSLRGPASPHFRGTNDDPTFRRHAVARRNTLIRTALGGIVAGVGLLVYEHRFNSRDRTEPPKVLQ